MTPIEAYELTLKKIKELKSEGIKIEIINSRSAQDKEIVNEFRGHFQRIPSDKWVSVNFIDLNITQANKINEASICLGKLGITFDNGGYQQERDWQLDWSFKFTGEVENEWIELKNQVEETIKDYNN